MSQATIADPALQAASEANLGRLRFPGLPPEIRQMVYQYLLPPWNTARAVHRQPIKWAYITGRLPKLRKQSPMIVTCGRFIRNCKAVANELQPLLAAKILLIVEGSDPIERLASFMDEHPTVAPCIESVLWEELCVLDREGMRRRATIPRVAETFKRLGVIHFLDLPRRSDGYGENDCYGVSLSMMPDSILNLRHIAKNFKNLRPIEPTFSLSRGDWPGGRSRGRLSAAFFCAAGKVPGRYVSFQPIDIAGEIRIRKQCIKRKRYKNWRIGSQATTLVESRAINEYDGIEIASATFAFLISAAALYHLLGAVESHHRQ